MDKNKRAIFVAAVILLAASFGYYLYFQNQQSHFYVAFLNVGQGDSALINFGNGKKMLVDCGPDRSVLSALGRHLPFYDRTIDYLLITHPDLDHYGGCVDVLKRYQVTIVITNGETKIQDSYWNIFDQAVFQLASASWVVDRPVNRTFGPPFSSYAENLEFQFLSPDPEFIFSDQEKTSNNNSIVFRLSRGNDSFLFMGDAEIPVENNLIKKYCASYDTCHNLISKVLKVGHHGSDTATSEEFLSTILSKTAVVSVGKNNFGHPSLRVLRHLERAGAQILRTDQKGDIIMPEI